MYGIFVWISFIFLTDNPIISSDLNLCNNLNPSKVARNLVNLRKRTIFVIQLLFVLHIHICGQICIRFTCIYLLCKAIIDGIVIFQRRNRRFVTLVNNKENINHQ